MYCKILDEQDIAQITKRVGDEINESLKNERKIPLIVGVLKGSLNFMLEIMKHIQIPIYTDYIQISSYFGTKRTTNVRLLKDVNYDCQNRTVVIVEDIVDTGHSMKFLIEHFKQHGAKKVLVCTLIDKKMAREVEVPIDFVGYVMKENHFVVGFGLDYKEIERNVPYIYEVDEDDVIEFEKILSRDKEE